METTDDKTAPTKLGTVITEEVYERLNTMLDSPDEGNHKMAQLILNQCDVPKSIYWIWKLAHRDYWKAERMVYRRTKASRNFIAECDFDRLRNKNAAQALRYITRKGWATPEIYEKLQQSAVRELEMWVKSNDLYKIYFELKPELKHLDPEDDIKELNP